MTTSPKLPFWLRATLFGSLALNLAVLGMLAGTVLHFHNDARRPAPVEAARGPYTHALTPTDRRALFRKLRDPSQNRPSREDAQASFVRVLDALRADPFSAEDLTKAMTDQQDLFARRAQHGQAMLIEHLAEMDPTARLSFADRLEEQLHHRREPPLRRD